MSLVKLSGPVSWYRFTDYNNNMYDLFGDRHFSYDYSCANDDYTISRLIDTIFQHNIKSNIITDLYLETGFIHKFHNLPNRRPPLRGYMDDVYAMLLNCLSPDKKGCQYDSQLVRIHYSDIRSISHKRYDIGIHLDLNTYINNFSPKIKDIVIGTGKCGTIGAQNVDPIYINEAREFYSTVVFIYENFINILSIMESYDDFPKNIDLLINEIPEGEAGNSIRKKLNNMKLLTSVRDGINMHKISLQFAKLGEIGNLIKLFIREKAVKIIEELKYDANIFNSSLNLLNYPNMINDASVTNLENSLETIRYQLVNLSSLIMDEYLLSRMFKSKDSRYVIIYAGAAHVNNYADFFINYIGIIPNYYNIDEDNRCIENYIMPF